MLAEAKNSCMQLELRRPKLLQAHVQLQVYMIWIVFLSTGGGMSPGNFVTGPCEVIFITSDVDCLKLEINASYLRFVFVDLIGTR